uniref:Putative secreted protein n=1 Tax=Ixodes ricinus TaxID=34613 RepID=A0A6B0UE62_IXORI
MIWATCMRLKRAMALMWVSTRPCSSGLTTAGQTKKAKTKSAHTTPARGSSPAPPPWVSVEWRRRTREASAGGNHSHELRNPSTKPCASLARRSRVQLR